MPLGSPIGAKSLELPMRAVGEIQNWLVERLAARPGATAVELDTPFATLGLSSKDAVAMIAQLGEWLGRSLSPAVIFNYPTVASLSGYLATEDEQPSETLALVENDVTAMSEKELEDLIEQEISRLR